MDQVIVRLCRSDDHTDTYDLRYQLLDNAFVPKWISEYQRTQTRGDDISTRDQFYGLNDDWSPEKTMSVINERVDQINQLVPGLIDRKIKNAHDQDTLNYLHAFFEKYHGKVDAWLTDPWWRDKPKEMRPIWSDLNNYIHRLEGYRNGSPSPQIKIAWYETPKISTFEKTDYDLFDTGYRFGYMYSLYADVGKDLKSLTYDEDEHHLDFVPPTFYSADIHLRFHTHTREQIKKIESDCRSFYRRNENFFKSKGFLEDDPRLVMGSLPVARLITSNDEQSILREISRHNRIQGVYLI